MAIKITIEINAKGITILNDELAKNQTILKINIYFSFFVLFRKPNYSRCFHFYFISNGDNRDRQLCGGIKRIPVERRDI